MWELEVEIRAWRHCGALGVYDEPRGYRWVIGINQWQEVSSAFKEVSRAGKDRASSQAPSLPTAYTSRSELMDEASEPLLEDTQARMTCTGGYEGGSCGDTARGLVCPLPESSVALRPACMRRW